jgi:hypothetical protein
MSQAKEPKEPKEPKEGKRERDTEGTGSNEGEEKLARKEPKAEEDDEDDYEKEREAIEAMFGQTEFVMSIPLNKMNDLLSTLPKILVHSYQSGRKKTFTIEGNNLTYEYVIKELIRQKFKKQDEDHVFLEDFFEMTGKKGHFQTFFGS